jgi:hypothetical protein
MVLAVVRHVNVERGEQGVTISGRSYALSFAADRPYAQLVDGGGRPWASLCLAWSVHAREGLDETMRLAEPSVEARPDETRVMVSAGSSLWRKKQIVFVCREESVEAWAEVRGEGRLADCHLFGGYYSGQLRWGSGFFQSGPAFRSVFNPEPWSSERRALPAAESTVADVLGTSLPGKGHWFFTPPPFCYVMSRERPPSGNGRRELPAGPWMTVGLAVRPGEHNFTGFHYDATEQAFSLRLTYEGQTAVDGEFTTPSTLFLFGDADPYAGMARYVEALRERRLVPSPHPPVRPAWWEEPIFCGWGAQCQLAGQAGGAAPDFARQEHYDSFLDALGQQGLTPGVVVLDDKWQRAYATGDADPEKWPDLKGWISRRHEVGQHVLLWWKAWDPEGLPAEQCVRNGAGEPVGADPSHPAYEATLRESVRRMLSREGYDADGFKVDFSARTPSGPSLVRHGREWGVELLNRLLRILYDEAKRVKPDALVMTHTPNPYFADVTDMIRLNDVNTGAPVVAQMRHRAQVARVACPSLLIDTDNWPMRDRATWREYLGVQNELGIPSLYFATHVGSGEPLEEADYAALREVCAEARRRIGTRRAG